MAQIYTDAQGRQVYDFNGKVFDAKTGQPVSGSLPSLSSTQTQGASTPTTPTVATKPTSSGNPLLDFSSTLSTAVNLARQKRNSLVLEKFGKAFPSGTLTASDFSPILSRLESSAQGTLGETLDIFNATGGIEAGQNTFDTVNVGGTLYEIEKDATGRVINQRPLVGGGGFGEDSEFSLAEEFASQFDGTDEELNRELRANTNLDAGDITAIVDARKQKLPDTQLQTLAQAMVTQLVGRSKENNTANKLLDAKGMAYDLLRANSVTNKGQPITLTNEQRQQLMNIISAFTAKDLGL